mmetsp:Transcript_13969/g.33800  ORF Transcript_13969/g.33800 Transcript_13969/m.33800 type:complete len:415 (-) Transcript_13969:153-1397(-)
MTQQKTTSILLLTLLALLNISTPAAAAAANKKLCIKMSRGKELKEKLATESNVLLVLGNDDDDKTYKELCDRLEGTPPGRVKDFEIAFVKDSNMRRNVMNKAAPPSLGLIGTAEKFVLDLITGAPPPKTEISYPEYVLYKTSNPEAGIRFVGGATIENDDEGKQMADAVSDFVSEQLQTKKIGSFVYALGSYDMVAAQIMKYETGSWQQRFWAEGVAKMLQTMFLKYPIASLLSTTTPVMEFEMELITNYIKIGQKVVEKGKNYPKEQVKRLEEMLENDDKSISELKKESMSQRVYTLKRFSEPEKFADKDIMSFLVKVGMNLLTLLLMLVMIPMMFLSSPEDDEEEEEEKEEKAGAEMEDPDKEEEENDEGSDSGTPLLTKQEKKALAIQRAKESMKEDKENVQKVLQKNGGK